MARSLAKKRAAGLFPVQALISVETKMLIKQVAKAKNKEQQFLIAEFIEEAIQKYIVTHGLPVESQMDLPIAS